MSSARTPAFTLAVALIVALLGLTAMQLAGAPTTGATTTAAATTPAVAPMFVCEGGWLTTDQWVSEGKVTGEWSYCEPGARPAGVNIAKLRAVIKACVVKGTTVAKCRKAAAKIGIKP